MIRELAAFPFDSYYKYEVFSKQEGRYWVVLIPIDSTSGLTRTTVSRARYNLSVALGRKLEKWEQVDHRDNNKLNDDPSNLQILTIAENNRKAASVKGKKMVKLRCPTCGTIFYKSRRETHLTPSRKQTFTACSKKCSSTFSALLQHYPNREDLLIALELNVMLEYTQH